MRKKFALLALTGILIWGVYAAGLLRHLDWESLRAQRGLWQATVQAEPWRSALVFLGVYVLVTGLSLPGISVLGLAAGALFGFWPGLLLASFGSGFGAACAFLLSRHLLRGWLEEKFGEALGRVDEGFARDGTFYLVFLRFVPAFPYFLVNLGAGLTSMPLARFYFVSQAAMLPVTAVYVNAGTALASLQDPRDAFGPRLLLAFTLLGIFPLAAKWAWRRRVMP